jgi:tetratricopeptide (TPR) repeat protein
MDASPVSAGAAATQLADARPKIDTPLRVQIPLSVNAPSRMDTLSRDLRIKQTAFSPAAFRNTATIKPVLALGPNTKIPPLAATEGSAVVNMDHDAQIKTAIRDYSVLAFSSKRAGKRDVEAAAYVSLAVIHDNQSNFQAGIAHYKQYLEICEEMGDTAGVAIACNCIGVSYMLMAIPDSDAGSLAAGKDPATNLQAVRTAAQFHQRHLSVSDQGGCFVANTNLGICYGILGDAVLSGQHHQEALRVAIKMQTLYGQSLSVGNLGLLALSKGDHQTARTCLEQHLQLVQTLQDVEAEVNAWKLLAKAAAAQDDNASVIEYLEHARRVAHRESYPSELRRIHCQIGVAKGSHTIQAYADNLLMQVQRAARNNNE